MEKLEGISCSDCGKSYSTVTNLNRHIKLNHLRKKKERPQGFYCEFCSQNFNRVFNLKRHIKRYHSDQDIDRKKFKYICTHCPSKFMHQYSYKKHLKKHNGLEVAKAKPLSNPEYRCAICNFSTYKKQLFVHFVQDHDIILQETRHSFESLEDFFTWKRSYEHETNSKFVKDYNTIRDDQMYKGFRCSHPENIVPNGRYNPKQRRREKYFCPAGIKLRKYKSGVYDVVVIETHVGHRLEKRDLKVTKSNNALLKTKVPFDCLFDEARFSVCDSNNPILSKHDLYNIETSFNLCTSLGDSDDLLGVDSWIKDLQDKTDDAILFYKAEGHLFEDFKELKEDDFVLVIMATPQSEILKMYGTGCVCIDLCRGTRGCNLQLVSLLVADEVGEVFPCGFLISNRIAKDVIKVFLQHVKFKIGMKIHPDVFMSDMDTCFYKAWVETMERPYLQLICPWYIDQAWRRHLKSRVIPQEKKLEVYQLLWTLIKQTDKTLFKEQLSKVYEYLFKDPATVEFSRYFKSHFMTNASCWFYGQTGLNSLLIFEKMHRILKCVHWLGQQVKRFDKTISAVMRLVREQYIDCLIKLDTVQLIKKKQDILSCHRTSLNMKLEFVTSTDHGVWNVLSGDQTKLYSVRKIKEHCDCQLKCINCKSCIHQFICSCIDSSISYNMCKHIHLFCRHPESANACVVIISPETVELQFAADDSCSGAEEENNDCVIAEHDYAASEDQIRQKLLSDLEEIVQMANPEELSIVKKHMATMKAELQDIKKAKVMCKQKTVSVRIIE